MNRASALERIQSAETPFDLLVIGGGASGLGTAVDAASRGHRVCLFEQADFAKGTSSRSTKLVHGGVRYLQQGNISLVLEALRERGRLSKNAPHLVHPQSFVIPNYSWWEGPFYGIGMKVYDQMAGSLGLAPSRHLSKSETIERIPTIEQKNLQGGVLYYDGQFDDARLAVHLAMTADALGACMVNYARCEGLIKESGQVNGAEIRDLESGKLFTVHAKAVINATGVFVDEIRRMDDPVSSDILSVSQGVHLVLPKRFLPGNNAIMIPKTNDGRVLFAVPWNDVVVVGTTDTPLEERSLEPRALEEEKNFILEHARQYLATDPGPEDVLSVFAGLRPLVGKGEDGDTSSISRDHTILVSESGLITLTGGKWTTYRQMAEDVIDQAETLAGLESDGCVTRNLQIHGWTQQEIEESHLRPYGSDARRIRKLEGQTPLHPELTLTAAEVVWYVREEMARTVEDVLARRCRALLLNAAASMEAAPTVASIMAGEMSKDAAWEKEQTEAYQQLASGYLFSV